MRRYLILIVILFFSRLVDAQQMTCPDVVAQALMNLADNCDSLDRNMACYGYNNVEATFDNDLPADFFSKPADRADLTDLEMIRTTAFDVEAGTWGIAVLEVQANVPNALPGQAVTMLLMGDAQLRNTVDTPFMPIDPISVTTTRQTIAFVQPAALQAETISAGTNLLADAQSLNGVWVRVVYDARPLWVAKADLLDSSALDTLPTLEPTPMQAFYFTGGLGTPTCHEAPNALTIQSHDGMLVDLTINGLDVRIGSTITLQQLDNDQLIMTVQEGSLQTTTNTVQTGQTLVASLNEENAIIAIEDIRPATEAELAVANLASEAIEQIVPANNPPEQSSPDELIHIVVRGDTLFSIARQYDASMPAIVRRNNLSDPSTIFVGQRLVIPNPGSGFVGLALAPVLTPTPASSDDVVVSVDEQADDCAAFRVISPTDGLAFGMNTFTWTELSNATSYRLTVENLTEAGSATFEVVAPANSLTVNLDQQTVGWGFDFSWRLQALINGQPICDTGSIIMQRAAVGVASPGILATWSCTGTGYSVTVNYSGAKVGEVLTISFYNPYDLSIKTLTASGPSGSVVIDGTTYMLYSGVDSGQLIDSNGVGYAITPTSLSTCP